MNKIIINATALRVGGALTILYQFIEAIPNDDLEYLVFVDESVKIGTSKSNLNIIPQNVRSFYKRFKWDAFGLKNWLKKNDIEPLIAISLQNTNFRLAVSCPNYIYYHQGISLFPFKWNFLNPQERTFWFYKNVYPYFVKIFINSKTEIFVQLKFIKEAFALKYNFPKNKIHVVFPKIKIQIFDDEYKINIDKKKLNLFYPATATFYKNHEILFKSLALIDKQLTRKIALYLTINDTDFEIPKDLNNVEFFFLGQLLFKEVLSMYKNVDALVYPSYIETLGLPLIEAASFGLPIIASDLPYAREVLDGYKGVTYIIYKDSKSWGNAIIQLSSTKSEKFESYKKEDVKTWSDFFKKIKENL